MKRAAVVVTMMLALAAPAVAQSAARRHVWAPGEEIKALHLNVEFDALVNAINTIWTSSLPSMFVNTASLTWNTTESEVVQANVSQSWVEALFSGAGGAAKIGAYTDPDGDVDSLAELFGHTYAKSRLCETFTVTSASGLALAWSKGYCWDANKNHAVQTWTAGSGTVTNNTTTYLYCDPDDATPTTLKLTTTDVKATDNAIELARAYAVDGQVIAIVISPLLSKKNSGALEAFRNVLPVAVTTGMVVSEDTDATVALDVVMSGGTWYRDMNTEYNPSQIHTRGGYLVRWYQSGGLWKQDTSSTQIDPTKRISGGNLVATTAAKYYKSWFVTDGTHVHWIYPATEFNTVAEAISGALDSGPPGANDFPRCTAVVMKGSDTSFPTAGGSRWIDIRQRPGNVTTFGGVTDHGSLAGLSDDDHTQYTLHTAFKNTSTVTWTTSATELYASVPTNAVTAADSYKLAGNTAATYANSKTTIEALLTGQIASHTHAAPSIDGGQLSNGRLPDTINATTAVQVAGVPVVRPVTFVDTTTVKWDTSSVGIVKCRAVLE